MLTGQRAAKGGEIGANGEWYKGGTFIARTDAPKGTHARAVYVPPSDEELAARALRAAEAAALEAIYLSWLEARKVLNRALIDAMRATRSEFYCSLADQLDNFGFLSPRQAAFAVQFHLGRSTKKNANEWDALHDRLTEQAAR